MNVGGALQARGPVKGLVLGLLHLGMYEAHSRAWQTLGLPTADTGPSV